MDYCKSSKIFVKVPVVLILFNFVVLDTILYIYDNAGSSRSIFSVFQILFRKYNVLCLNTCFATRNLRKRFNVLVRCVQTLSVPACRLETLKRRVSSTQEQSP